jgi:opacity protein-like surface antigen
MMKPLLLPAINSDVGCIADHMSTACWGATMKAYLASVSVLAFSFALPAMAADLPAKARPAPVYQSNWTGFYLGIHGGYGWGDSPFSQPFFGPEDTFTTIGGIDSRGSVFGAHAGHNWQYGRIVTGLEIDFSATGIEGSTSATLSVSREGFTETETTTLKDRVKYLGSVRARLGILPADSVLLYGTAGLAWQRLERTESDEDIQINGDIVRTFRFTETIPIDRFGWVAGAGTEARLFGGNWLGRIEYLHYDFDRFDTFQQTNTTDGVVRLDTRATSGRQTIDVVRAGLSYKFAPN